jgi:membrane-anchored mycosin MYCP
MSARAVLVAAATVLAIVGAPAVGASAPRSAAVVAGQITPPVVDPRALIPNAPVAPPVPTEQRSTCGHPVWDGPPLRGEPPAQRGLDLAAAWRFSRGYGQTVAVIDTGVSRHPRLPILVGGGDYVSNTDGTVDCDGHGTFIAGIIAARPSAGDDFAGVAPDAAILSIRQLSLEYQARGAGSESAPGTIASGGFGNVLTLGEAVVHAVDMGATVINISEVACAPAGTGLNDGALGAAVQYAYNRNVVVVTAAGNVSQSCQKQNDGNGWDAVNTEASPAWFAPYVLPVASMDPDGSPSAFSLHGPWVAVCAPGRQIVSLDSTPGGTGLVNSIPTADGVSTIDGTSFASAYVAGLAALVRARFPQLSAQGVIDRIRRTAHGYGAGHNDMIGAGAIDPLAALTAQLPDSATHAPLTRPVPPPRSPAPGDPWPRRIAVAGASVCLALVLAWWAVAIAYRRRWTSPGPFDDEDV